MKTSLNLLHATSACVGGFGRQASFLTVRPAAKAIEYPIWLVGLIGQFDDLQWAINNSLIVDEAEFKELKARTFLPMFQCVLWQNLSIEEIVKVAEQKPGNIFRDAVQDVLKVTTAEQAEEWITKYQRYKLNSTIFNAVANAPCWSNPQQYLAMLTSLIFSEKPEHLLEHEAFPFNLDTHLPGHDSRTGGYKKKAIAVKRVRRAVASSPEAAPAPKDNSYFNIPRPSGRKMTKGEAFAYVMLGGDPWPAALEFMVEKDLPRIIGTKVNLTKVSPDGKKPPQFSASLHLNDPRTIFTLIQLLQGRSFDVFAAMGLAPDFKKMEEILAGRFGVSGMADLDNIDLTDSYSVERAVSDVERAERERGDRGADNGALPERTRRPTEGQAHEDWDTVSTPVTAGGDSDDEEEDDDS